MKAALCFIVNYDHILHKEHLWREWIEPNKDIINVYFYYKDLRKIKSRWMMEHTLPPHMIVDTNYYHVIPAYLALFEFALRHDPSNAWFCMLTDSCCPIVSPKRFRHLFFQYHARSLVSWKPAWWNPHFHQRANLAKLPTELWLANDPWFVFTKRHVCKTLHFVQSQSAITRTVCAGGFANESLFAIILKLCGELPCVECVVTHLTDWGRRSSTTSPHVFQSANEQDLEFLERELERNPCALFLRKVAPEFPDDVLRRYIYEFGKTKDDQLVLVDPRREKRRNIAFMAAGGLLCLLWMCWWAFK